ncbi:MAG: tRNA (adenosine(37)-N6)-threonylcarbamoyltransferase complex dimerization subunit type 1 TsaB, partial [Planctomycetota bacterium]
MTPRILAVDVSGPRGGAAYLGPEGALLATLEASRGRDLIPSIERLLARAGVAAGRLDCVACGVGPGSFTGIRIGVATASALAFALDLPAIGLGSLHGIAENAPPHAGSVLVAIDARRGNVFSGLFRREAGRLAEAGPYRNAPPAEVARDLP